MVLYQYHRTFRCLGHKDQFPLLIATSFHSSVKRKYDLLEYLMRNSGRVVTKTMIMEHVWEYHFDPQTNVVETRIYKLREKVDKPFSRELIHTVRGIGYILE